MRAALLLSLLALGAGEAAANDRLSAEIRPAFGAAMKELREYARYIVDRTWQKKLRELLAAGLRGQALRSRASEAADEIVHLVLPYARKVVDDVVFGTGGTYVRFTMPGRGGVRARVNEAPAGLGDLVQAALRGAGRAGGRALSDRLDQALLEDLEDAVQRELERRLHLPIRGRPRDRVRPLSPRYQGAYAAGVRESVHRFTYWWLRKRSRLLFARLATQGTQEELDRARHTGAVWGLASAISLEQWRLNRLRLDFKWGWPNWRIDRRRIRRRMDQDTARATWALAKLVNALGAPEVTQEIERTARRELDGALRDRPAPPSRSELREALRNLGPALDRVYDRAMDRVKLPGDLRELAREHARRYMNEEMEGSLARIGHEEAAAHAARQRVGEALPRWVHQALEKVGTASRQDAVARAAAEVAPRIDREIEDTLRGAGLDDKLWDPRGGAEEVRQIRRRFELEEAARREARRQLDAAGGNR